MGLAGATGRGLSAEGEDPPQDLQRTLAAILWRHQNGAKWRAVPRIVTTNFDLLFEACDSSIKSSGPPNLPDPRSDLDFRGGVQAR
jgi:hypothetical protein